MEEKKWKIIYFIMLIAIIVFSFVMGIMDAFYDNVIGFSIIGVFISLAVHFICILLMRDKVNKYYDVRAMFGKEILIFLLLFISLMGVKVGQLINPNKPIEPGNLAYTISYWTTECGEQYLKLYDNNTYEFVYYYKDAYGNLKHRRGTYDYDIEQLISNFPKYQDNSLYNDYSVKKSSGERYSTNKNNTELQSFLKSIDVSLDKCLMSEYD